jgi:hypothetical protein
MDWVKAGNDFLSRLGGGLGISGSGLERWRTKFLTGVGRFYEGIDHTVLICAAVILVLGVIFWISLRGKAEY